VKTKLAKEGVIVDTKYKRLPHRKTTQNQPPTKLIQQKLIDKTFLPNTLPQKRKTSTNSTSEMKNTY